MSEKLIDSFKAKDKFGTVHTINCFQKIVMVPNLNGSIQELGGSKRFECKFGHVNCIDDHTFEILELNTIAKKIIS
jgi:hypothetical protein